MIAIGPDAEPVPAVDADRSRIVVGRDAEWIEANGIRHRPASRRPLRRLLFALAEARCAPAGSALSVDELLDSGWPGEDPLPEAGSNRVYVAISSRASSASALCCTYRTVATASIPPCRSGSNPAAESRRDGNDGLLGRAP